MRAEQWPQEELTWQRYVRAARAVERRPTLNEYRASCLTAEECDGFLAWLEQINGGPVRKFDTLTKLTPERGDGTGITGEVGFSIND